MRLIKGELRSGYNEWSLLCRMGGTAEVSCNTGKDRSKREPTQSKSLAFLTTLGELLNSSNSITCRWSN